MLKRITELFECLPGRLRHRVRTDNGMEGRLLERYWSTPRVLPFTSLEGDGSGDAGLTCLLEGWQSPLRVRLDNPRYRELRELLVAMHYGEAVRAKIDFEKSELVWAERSLETPEVPIMDVHIHGADGKIELFAPGLEMQARSLVGSDG